MSAVALGSSQRRRRLHLPSRVLFVLAVAIAAASFGFLTAAGPAAWLGAICGLVFVEISALAVFQWRRIATLMVACLPYTGILSLLLYPRTFLGDVVRDAMIVTPLYIGVFATRERIWLPRAIVVPFSLLGLLAVLQLANPSLPSLAVGLVGLRGWLFFAPMLLVGARLARDRIATLRMLRIALLAGLPVLVIGLAEAFMLAAGGARLLYAIYGSAAEAAFSSTDSTQGAAVSLGDLHRVPSLFSHAAAYYVFCVAMLAPAYVLWRSGDTRRVRALGRGGFILAVLAGLTCGTREAFLVVPLVILVTLFLDRGLPGIHALAGGGIGLAAVAWVMNIPLRTLPGYLLGLSKQEGGDLLGHGFRLARSLTWLGLGPGTDTNAARNVAGPGIFAAIGGRWQESYFVKSWIELGVPGLVLVMWLLWAVGASVIRSAKRASSGRPLVAVSAGLFVGAVATSVKGAILDQAPANAYVWLFAGLALGARAWSSPNKQLEVQPPVGEALQ
jgi:hypothetical protein